MISKELADHISQNLATFTLEELQTLQLVLFGEPEQNTTIQENVKRLVREKILKDRGER